MTTKVEWLGGPNDAEHMHVQDHVLQTGFVRLPDYEHPVDPFKVDDTLPVFSEKPKIIRYPIRRYSVIDAITRRRYEKLMIDFYSRTPE